MTAFTLNTDTSNGQNGGVDLHALRDADEFDFFRIRRRGLDAIQQSMVLFGFVKIVDNDPHNNLQFK